jgi:hypothetical protein
MVADIFTKPLQGSAFRKFRNVILNLPSLKPDLTASSALSSQECVGNHLAGVRKDTKDMKDTDITSGGEEDLGNG